MSVHLQKYRLGILVLVKELVTWFNWRRPNIRRGQDGEEDMKRENRLLALGLVAAAALVRPHRMQLLLLTSGRT